MLAPRWQRLIDDLRRGEKSPFVVDEDLEQALTLGRYLVVDRIGAGGMGAVFEAIDPDLNRPVALKVCKLPPDDAAGMIEHEARCLAKLAHPNVVAVYDVVRDGPDLVLVMEFVNGQTLREWQRAANPTWREILDRYCDAARGLAAAHAEGLEHGDFKPDNVLVGDDGRVRVIDFGIARHSYDLIDDHLGLKGKGTPKYMAPERLREQPGGVAADVYAFCVSVWEALYGARPFAGETVAALLDAIEAGKPCKGSAVPGVPAAIESVLRRGLSERASERPPSIEALVEALNGAREARARRWRWIKRGVVAASLLVAAGLIWEPQPSPIEQTLVLAKAEARDGDTRSAVDYLELARKRARQEGDREALQMVAETAEQLGHVAMERGDGRSARESWSIAHGVFLELGDADALERLARVLADTNSWP
jgi:serine/threonine protein kinase